MPIKTETKTIYITDDEREFTDKQEAEEHQALLDSKEGINAFVEQMPVTELGQTKARNLLMKFVQFDAARRFRLDKEAEEAGL